MKDAKRILKRVATAALVLGAVAVVASPAAQSGESTEVRSRTLTVQPNIGYQCVNAPNLIEPIGPTTNPAEAEGYLFVTEQVNEICIASDYETPVDVTVYYLALRR